MNVIDVSTAQCDRTSRTVEIPTLGDALRRRPCAVDVGDFCPVLPWAGYELAFRLDSHCPIPFFVPPGIAEAISAAIFGISSFVIPDGSSRH